MSALSLVDPVTPAQKSVETRRRNRLLHLVERDGLSIAAAARVLRLPVTYAGALICSIAEEREQADYDTALRDEIHAEWSRLCGDDDDTAERENYLRYTSSELDAIEELRSIPNRAVRNLIEQHITCAEPTLTLPILARRLGYADATSIRRSLGYRKASDSIKRGRRYPGRVQRTISLGQAAEILRALGVPLHEVPGL
jgi:hypothetical protein